MAANVDTGGRRLAGLRTGGLEQTDRASRPGGAASDAERTSPSAPNGPVPERGSLAGFDDLGGSADPLQAGPRLLRILKRAGREHALGPIPRGHDNPARSGGLLPGEAAHHGDGVKPTTSWVKKDHVVAGGFAGGDELITVAAGDGLVSKLLPAVRASVHNRIVGGAAAY